MEIKDFDPQTLAMLKAKYGDEAMAKLAKSSNAYPEHYSQMAAAAEAPSARMASVAELAALKKPSMVGELTKTLTSPQAEEAGSLLRNKAGFAKLLPMLGMAAMAPAAMGIAKKAQEGDLKGAALEAADIGSYAVPGLGQARLIGDAAMGTLGTTPESEAVENPSSSNFQKLRNRLASK